ncbi:MAG: hypothetical protein AAF958_01555 [Planctomycetota bacterium]
MAACVVLAVAFWSSQNRSLYAQTTRALDRVQTIHVTGWTTRLVRKWPLEAPGKSTADQRHVIDSWYWYDEGTPVSHERMGPLILTRDGKEFKEFQSDADLIFISEPNAKDYVERFTSMQEFFHLLQQENTDVQALGMRADQGRQLRGLRLSRSSGVTDAWFDVATNLPIQVSMMGYNGNAKAILTQLDFAYDQPIPPSTLAYQMPAASQIRYGYGKSEQEVIWDRHVQNLDRQLANDDSDEPIRIIPRASGRSFSFQYQKPTPSGKYQVLPLDCNQYRPLTVRDFIARSVSTSEGERAVWTWRLDREQHDCEFPRADLVFKTGTPWQQWVQFALRSLELEYVDREETRTFWIAEHDGRELQSWENVHPPVPYIVEGGEVQHGLVRTGIGRGLKHVTLSRLFLDFNRDQNHYLTASGRIIIDQTGLPTPPVWDRKEYSTFQEFADAVDYNQHYFASDSPTFYGKGSSQMARDWYEKEFGITFREEQRPVTVHVIGRVDR